MPYLTPDEIPEESDCRSLFIPASPEWLAIFSGALTELTKTWNWEQGGAVTVSEAVALCQSIIAAYYDGCVSCELPGGGKIIRIGNHGQLEELVDGAWVPPTGDYVIPPPEAREGGDSLDQNCLAAKNAANVLRQLYESLSESWAAELTADEALVAFIAALVAIVGFAFAPITFAIAAFLFVIFEAAFEALEFVTADLWDESFTDQMVCILLGCAENNAGVVTFDWDCLNAAFTRQANDFSLTDEQLRLYIQIGYIMYFIGGTDGLNLAGGTTEITDDSCDDCDNVWGRKMDFRLSDWGFAAVADPVNGGTVGSYSSGVGFVTRYYPAGGDDISLQTARTWTPASPVTCIRLTVAIDEYYGSPAGIYVRTAEYEGTVFYNTNFINEAGENVYLIAASDSNGGYNFQLYNLGSMSCTLIMAEIWGTGAPPEVGTATFEAPPC